MPLGKKTPEKSPLEKYPEKLLYYFLLLLALSYSCPFLNFLVTSFRGVSRASEHLQWISLWHYLTVLTNVTKNSILDNAGVEDLPLSLLGEVFQRYLSVSHIAQLVTYGKTVRIAKSVFCKIIARIDIISNKQFRAPTIYLQVLIFINKSCCYK